MKKIQCEQRSPEWEQLRKTHITGTVVKSIMGTPKARKEAYYEAIANRLTVGVDSDNDYENPMDRGTRLEPEAIAIFELETGKTTECVGFCESEDNEAVAMSPDRYVKGTNDTEAVEVKCMGGKNHVRLWLENVIPDDYFWQVVQYFVVNDSLEKLYFVGYNPQIPAHPLHIIEVSRGDLEEKIKFCKEEQDRFLNEVNEMLKTLINF